MTVTGPDADAIRAVLHDYARGVDDRDWKRVERCYHADAVDDHGVYVGDPAGLVAYFDEHLAGVYDGTLHVMTGSDLRRVDDTTIDSSTLCLALHWPPAGSGGRHLVMVADYDDRFERRDDAWRIARRTVRVRMAEEFDAASEVWPLLDRFRRSEP
ncbi:MAG: nuclear transport factor 2 family protein [Ilumatobacter fluminis]|uniref:nuclear transport factor 2 family protein n=1 Tax=Ilumatobacter fluminis TaxID=467091 RepID=UPI0032EE8480